MAFLRPQMSAAEMDQNQPQLATIDMDSEIDTFDLDIDSVLQEMFSLQSAAIPATSVETPTTLPSSTSTTPATTSAPQTQTSLPPSTTSPPRITSTVPARVTPPTTPVQSAAVLLSTTHTPEQEITLNLVNHERAIRGLNPFLSSAVLDEKAMEWAAQLALEDTLRHSNVEEGNNENWIRLAENVGSGGSQQQVHASFMNSPSHRDHIIDPRINYIGVGYAQSANGKIFIVHEFMETEF